MGIAKYGARETRERLPVIWCMRTGYITTFSMVCEVGRGDEMLRLEQWFVFVNFRILFFRERLSFRESRALDAIGICLLPIERIIQCMERSEWMWNMSGSKKC